MALHTRDIVPNLSKNREHLHQLLVCFKQRGIYHERQMNAMPGGGGEGGVSGWKYAEDVAS